MPYIASSCCLLLWLLLATAAVTTTTSTDEPREGPATTCNNSLSPVNLGSCWYPRPSCAVQELQCLRQLSRGNLHITPHIFSTLLELLHLGTQQEVFTFTPHQCRFSLCKRCTEPLLFSFLRLR